MIRAIIILQYKERKLKLAWIGQIMSLQRICVVDEPPNTPNKEIEKRPKEF
jgi:hypothetical protein